MKKGRLTRRRFMATSKMVLRMAKGEPMEKSLAWATAEVEGFYRN